MGMHNVRHHALRFLFAKDPRFRYRENISQVTVAKTWNDGDGGNKGKRL